MAFENVLASVAVRELASARQWYEKLLGRGPDRTPMPTVAEWYFPRGGGLQVYELAERAGACSCTILTHDLALHIDALTRLGVDTGTRTKSASVKTVMVTDPDGNHIAIAGPAGR